ncbi:WXG100 family type VII secretion target [Leucobacter chromiiresistens]
MITLDEAGAQEKTAQISARLSAMGATLQQLDARIDVLHQAWSGEAQAAYAHAHAQWREHMDAMRHVALQVVNGANAATETLCNTESAVYQLWT